jgi:hypothetical protein
MLRRLAERQRSISNPWLFGAPGVVGDLSARINLHRTPDRTPEERHKNAEMLCGLGEAPN